MEMNTGTLFIEGPISNGDIRYLQGLFAGDNIAVDRYRTKGATIGGIVHDIHLIFEDFKTIDFLRDYFLAELINQFRQRVFPLVGKAVLFLSKKRKNIRTIFIAVRVNCGGRETQLEFVMPFEQVEMFIQNLEFLLSSEILVHLCSKEKLFFNFSNGSLTMTIFD
jgi:hypothetical protein